MVTIMTIVFRAAALALACLALSAAPAFAAEPAPTFLDEMWAEVRPALLTLIAGLVPILATWLTAELVKRLKVAKDSDLALSLGRTIDTTLKALLARLGSQAAGTPTAQLVDNAMQIIKRDNPKAVAVHAPTDDQLATKIIAQVPEAKAAVVEAAATLATATRRPVV